MVVDRRHAENFDKGFAVKPQLVSDKAYVHMYLHRAIVRQMSGELTRADVEGIILTHKLNTITNG